MGTLHVVLGNQVGYVIHLFEHEQVKVFLFEPLDVSHTQLRGGGRRWSQCGLMSPNWWLWKKRRLWLQNTPATSMYFVFWTVANNTANWRRGLAR
jgi:hypothetical protein